MVHIVKNERAAGAAVLKLHKLIVHAINQLWSCSERKVGFLGCVQGPAALSTSHSGPSGQLLATAARSAPNCCSAGACHLTPFAR